MWKPRGSKSATSYAKIHHSISVKEARKLKQLKKASLCCAAKLKKTKIENPDNIELLNKLELALTESLLAVHKLGYYFDNIRRKYRKNRSINKARTIESFTENACWKRFRFRKLDLYDLQIALQLKLEPGEYFQADNGMKFTGEEILLIGLHRFCIPGPLEQSMQPIFDLDYSALSRAVTIFNQHMLYHHKHLVTDNLEYWSQYFPIFAECVREKLNEKGDVYYEPGTFRVAMFHDDTVIATCRPGSGPNRRTGGRHCNYIQMAFYNGWKKHHGIKYQTIEFPNGMCGDMFGPCSFRHNDLELLRDSDLNEKLRLVQIGNLLQYVSYGDGIFPINSHTIGKHIGNTTEDERYENRMMSKIRICNEWDYGVTANLFPFAKDKRAYKLRGNKLCGHFYLVATILRNAHLCLYEGLTSSYFQCPTPTLFEYFRVN